MFKFIYHVTESLKEFQSYKDGEEPPHHFVTNGTVAYQNQYVYCQVQTNKTLALKYYS